MTQTSSPGLAPSRAADADRTRPFARWAPWLLSVLTTVLLVATLILVAIYPSGATEEPWEGTLVGIGLLVTTVAFLVVGTMISFKRPGNPMGLLSLAIGFGLAVGDLIGVLAPLLFRPDLLPGATFLVWVGNWSWAIPVGLLGTFFVLLFPDGHLPSRRWLPVAWLSALGIVSGCAAEALTPGQLSDNPGVVNPFGVESEALVGILGAGLVLLPLGFIASTVAMVMRFRRARGDERLQLKWFAFATAILGVSFGIYMLTPHSILGTNEFGGGRPLFEGFISFAFAGLPIAAGIAILKYRLYEIDVIVNKTVVYGTLAAFVTAVYVAIVVGAGAIFSTGDESTIPLSIAATALVALAFDPVRRRVQRFANRLVYGERATPYEVLSRFSETIASSLGAEELLPATAAMLRDATRAEQACVWLRIDDSLVPGAVAPTESMEQLEPRRLASEGLPDLPGSMSTPVYHQGELLGALTITKARGESVTPTERELLGGLASQAGQVLRNERLTADLQARLDQLAAQAHEIRLSRRRIVDAQDDERRALERNIHDGAQQHLVALAVKLKLAKTLAARAPERAETLVEELRHAVDDAVDTLRTLAAGVYPTVLEKRGLAAALEEQAGVLPITTVVDADGVGRLPLGTEATVYFCCLEAMQNVAKYSGASNAQITLRMDDGELLFSVADDGTGFDVRSTPPGSGLRNMSDRVAAAGGELEITSAPDLGTSVIGRVPTSVLEDAS